MEKASRPGQNTNANARDLTDSSRSNRDFRQTDGVQMFVQHSAIERGESNDAGTHRTDTCVRKAAHTLRTVQNFGERARGGRASTAFQVVVCGMVCTRDWTNSRGGRRALPGAGGNPGRPCRKAVVRANAEST